MPPVNVESSTVTRRSAGVVPDTGVTVSHVAPLVTVTVNGAAIEALNWMGCAAAAGVAPRVCEKVSDVGEAVRCWRP